MNIMYGPFLLLSSIYIGSYDYHDDKAFNNEGKELRSWRIVFGHWDLSHISWKQDSWCIHRGMEPAPWASDSRCLTALNRTGLDLNMNSTPPDCMSYLPLLPPAPSL